MTDNNHKSKRVTINDIARISGYSKTSVSFAFNEPKRISEKARNVILKVAEDLGYIPNPLARNFSLRKHHSIGILLPQLINSSLSNPFIAQVIQGVASVCQKYGYTLTLIPPLNESISDAVRTAAVDGLITLGMEAEMKVVRVIRQRKIPYVTIDGSPSANMPSINIRDREAAKDIMKLVLNAGHRHITIVSLPEGGDELGVHNSVTWFRMEGYNEALAECSMCLDSAEITVLTAECTIDGGKSAGAVILKEHTKPTAVVCMSDIIAIGCQQEFQAAGLNIPNDISLVGFDNIIESAMITPALTTVDQPGSEKGRQATELVFQLIRDEVEDAEPHHIIVPYRIIKRDSLKTL
ncbi:MAG: LacI family DNA-binding transcriptional regulator [Bacteroidetes bacterium]|nr:LacI family DNA-binding transcriptional regulator [Bacteroidota bacterium]